MGMQLEILEENIYVPSFWKNIEVRYDVIYELDDTKTNILMKSFLNTLTIDELKELTYVLQITTEDNDPKKTMIDNITEISDAEKFLLLLLNDFQKFKKKTITKYYNNVYDNPHIKVHLAKLFVLFNDEPEHLSSILAYHYWLSRASGNLLYCDDKIKSSEAFKMINTKENEKLLLKNIKKAANKDDIDYRFFKHVVIDNNTFISLVYKQVNDKSIPDYDEALRNKEVKVILFSIDIASNTIEIKADSAYENEGIKQYIENVSKTNLTPVSNTVVNNYIGADILHTMMGEATASGEIVEDFLVDSVTFRTSSLKNAAEISLTTKNTDVWPSVADACQKNSVNLTSLKDLKSLSIKSNNVSRTITSNIKKNGNIIFRMNDANLDKSILDDIKQKFKDKFGIPLFHEISNYQFDAGKADLIDYVFGYCNQLQPGEIRDENITTIYSKLKEVKLLNKNEISYMSCINYTCAFNDEPQKSTSDIDKCPICEEEIKSFKETQHEINLKEIEKIVKRKLRQWCQDNNWTLKNNSTLTFAKEKMSFIKLQNHDGETLQFLLAHQTVNKKLVEQINKMLNSTVIIFIGQKEELIEGYSENCIQAITFGHFYIQEADDMNVFMNHIYGELKTRTKNAIAYAAQKAYQSMQQIAGNPSSFSKADYSADDLEDDGYALLKDIFLNAVKWGKEKSGQAYPEGVFTLSYPKHGRDIESYAFSFDFKLAYQDSGYPLGRDEHRKAIEYVNDLNDSEEIRYYSIHEELSGHIFISNKFNDKQKENVQEYFEEYLTNRRRTKAIFMTTNALMQLHRLYRIHYDDIEAKKIQFYHRLYTLFMDKSNGIDSDDIDQLIQRVLKSKHEDFKTIDMALLSEDL